MLVAAGALGARSAVAQCQTYTVASGPATFIAGTTDIGNNGDEVTTDITFPFPVSLYGQAYTSATVGSNGFLQFGGTPPADSLAYANACLPTSNFDAPVILAHWDDLNTDGGVWTSLSGSPGSQTFAIEWRAFSYDSGATGLDFEIIFYENQSYFDVVFNSTDSGAGATVGVQQSINVATSFCCNTAGLSNGLSLRFTCGDFVNPGACCDASGQCSIAPQATCSTPQFVLGGTCTPTTCPSGSCCTGSGCTIVLEGYCTSPYFDLNGTCEPIASCEPPRPANDNCAGATDLSAATFPDPVTEDGAPAATDTLSTSFDPVFGPLTFFNGVWFSYTSSTSGYFTYKTTMDLGGERVVLFSLTGGCDQPTIDGHEFDGLTVFGPKPQEYYLSDAGQTLDVLVSSGFSTSDQSFVVGGVTTAPYDVTFDFLPDVVPPNDTCEGAVDLNAVTLPYETAVNNTVANEDDTTCPDTLYDGVWYKYTASSYGQLTCSAVRIADSSQQAEWAAYIGTGCGLPTCVGDGTEVQQVTLYPGQTVKLVVGSKLPAVFSLLRLQFSFTPSPCPADFDNSGTVNVSDIFAFLRSWFGHDSAADIDGNGTVNVSDIFAFLRHWFSHC